MTEWLAALADGEAARMAARFAKEANSSRARRPAPETEAARRDRFEAEFLAASEQRKQGVRQASALVHRSAPATAADVLDILDAEVQA